MNDEHDKTEKQPVEDRAMSEPDVQPEQPVGAENFDLTIMNVDVPPTSATTEHWAMNVPSTNSFAEKAPDTWEMPSPVFRVSSGRKLDKSNQKTPPMPLSDSPPVEAQTPEIVETVAPPSPDIQPQPYISEEFSANQIVAKTYVKPKSNSSKLILLIVGLVVMAVLVAALAVGVYYWFFYMPE
jgi:hypothetical protein